MLGTPFILLFVILTLLDMEKLGIDNIKVSGGIDGQGDEIGNLCGTFQNYNIYMDGVLIDSLETQELTVEGLTNETEYYQITAKYEEENQEQSTVELRDSSRAISDWAFKFKFCLISARIL